MIRSLIIRQIFRFLDVALALAVFVAGGFAVSQFFTPMPTVDIDEAFLTVETLETAGLVQRPDTRASYDGLVASRLFGPAGLWDPDAAPIAPEEPPEPDIAPEIAESTLNLQLKGTIALTPGDPFSVAFIENLDEREPPRSFLIGTEVVDDVILELVYKREVILLNSRNEPPQRERLRMEDATGDDQSSRAQMASRSAPRTYPQRATRPTPPVGSDSAVERITIDRNELMQEVFDNYASLSTLRPQLYRDDAGNVLGLTADNISQQPLARKLGFQDNDVLQTVNNERIDSEERIMEIIQRYQNANSFRIGILRDGRPRVLNFRLD